jgi:hypothetical protein
LVIASRVFQELSYIGNLTILIWLAGSDCMERDVDGIFLFPFSHNELF